MFRSTRKNSAHHDVIVKFGASESFEKPLTFSLLTRYEGKKERENGRVVAVGGLCREVQRTDRGALPHMRVGLVCQY
jgi:hypothetical protein